MISMCEANLNSPGLVFSCLKVMKEEIDIDYSFEKIKEKSKDKCYFTKRMWIVLGNLKPEKI